MMEPLLQNDEAQRPDLFHWHGSLDKGVVEEWLSRQHVTLPDDLVELWVRTGGGDLFETETILAPMSQNEDERADVVNRELRNRGLPERYFVFHVGLGGLSAVRLTDGVYLQLDDSDFVETGLYVSLEDWYRRVLRAEYAVRYGLA
jgi:hypothetical protein